MSLISNFLVDPQNGANFTNGAPPANGSVAGFTDPGFTPNSNNFSPVNNNSLTDNLISSIQNGGDISGFQAMGNDNTGGFSNFVSNFKNGDGSLNFGNIGQGVGMLGDVFNTFMALKQFGMAEDAFKQNSAITKDNHNNNIAITQQQIDDRNRIRAMDNQAANAAAAQLGLPAPVAAPVLQNSLGGGQSNGANLKARRGNGG